MDNRKRESANKDESEAKKQNVVTLEVKTESNINGVIEEIVYHGTVDTAATQETLDMQPEDPSEGELISKYENNSCEKKTMKSQRK